MNTINACTIGFLILAVSTGIYLKWPPPDLSHRLIAWKNPGKYYSFQNYHQIFYRDDVGQGPDNEVLLLIHGYPTSSYDWYKVYDGLKSKFGRIIAPDMLGYGFSSKPGYQYIVKMEPTAHLVEIEHNYTIAEQADILQDILKHQNISAVHILSHDYGDTVAQELVHRLLKTSDQPTNISMPRIKTLCMLNGGLFPDIYSPRLIQKLMLYPYLKKIIPKLLNYWFFSKSLKGVFARNHMPTSEEVEDWWALARYNDGENALARLISYIPERKLYANQWTEAIQRTTAKVHFIYGPEDPVNPAPFEERFRETFPKATIDVLPDIGHYVQQEAPMEMLESYFKFLERA